MLQFFPFPLLIPAVVIIGVLVLIGLTLGFFMLTYIIMMIYAGMNPWVRDTKRMNWCCNPAFSIWYFEHKRRKWVASNFGGSIFIAIIFWFLFMLWISFYYIPILGDFVFFSNLVITLVLGIIFSILIGYGIVRLHSPSLG